MRYLVLAMIGAAACGGAKAPATMPDPARGLVNLASDDQQVSAIAVAAARALLPTTSAGTVQPFFGGVFVGGRRVRLATDAVARATGFSPVSTARTPTPQCRAQNMSTGQSVPIPCPASAKAMVPPTLTFQEVRATADSAYVGVDESTDVSTKSSCMTLVRSGTAWNYLATNVIADARRCGTSR